MIPSAKRDQKVTRESNDSSTENSALVLSSDEILGIDDTRDCTKYNQRPTKQVSSNNSNHLQLEERHQLLFAKISRQRVSTCCDHDVTIVVEEAIYE